MNRPANKFQLNKYPPTPPMKGERAYRRFDPAVRKRFSKAMCRGVFYVVGRRCSRLSEVVFRFPRPCAEVFFMLSEGAVRGFRKWFFKVSRCCRKALFEAFGSGFSRPCVEVSSERIQRTNGRATLLDRSVFYDVGANPTSVPC